MPSFLNMRSATIRRHPVASYFLITFLVSWTLAFSVLSPELLQGRPVSQFDGILMFPAMLIGPAVSGIVLTRIVDGRTGLTGLFGQMRKWRVGKYALGLLVPPILILITLYILRSLVSTVFIPNLFVFGIGFGVLAGILEEIGWTGFAFRKLNLRYGAFNSAIILGLVWGLWHAPVVDFLGAAYPHGGYWLPFYLSFVGIVVAVRVLIVWMFTNTRSLLAGQLTHASSTGFLAVLAPAAVVPAQEAGWYAAYGAMLWIVALVIRVHLGPRLTRQKTA